MAIKFLFCIELTPERIVDFCNEATLLNSLRHPNMVTCYGVAIMPPAISLVTEYCTWGSLFDFLPENYKSNYLGIDLSKEAIAYAQKKRGNSSNLSSIQVYQPQFQQSAAHLFTLPNPTTKYDVIVFSDVLYYVEYKKILPQYVQYLVNTNGVIIISIFHIKKEQLLYEEIFQFARNSMEYIDEIDLSGLSSYAKKKPRKYTGWHMEIYRKN